MKDAVLAILAAVAAIAWELIVANNPDFPLAQTDFVNFVTYLFAGIAGWQALKVKMKFTTGKTYKQLIGK